MYHRDSFGNLERRRVGVTEPMSVASWRVSGRASPGVCGCWRSKRGWRQETRIESVEASCVCVCVCIFLVEGLFPGIQQYSGVYV